MRNLGLPELLVPSVVGILLCSLVLLCYLGFSGRPVLWDLKALRAGTAVKS